MASARMNPLCTATRHNSLPALRSLSIRTLLKIFLAICSNAVHYYVFLEIRMGTIIDGRSLHVFFCAIDSLLLHCYFSRFQRPRQTVLISPALALYVLSLATSLRCNIMKVTKFPVCSRRHSMAHRSMLLLLMLLHRDCNSLQLQHPRDSLTH